MARVFLGPDRTTAPKVTFLWSLGDGREARGYGKSAYLMWFERSINADFGAAILKMCGGPPAPAEKVVAVYTSFSTVEAVSLSGALHGATRDFIARNRELLARLRSDWVRGRRSHGDLELEVRKYTSRASDPVKANVPHDLTYADPSSWQYIAGAHRLWHKQRLGRSLFGGLVAFLRAVGITRVVLLVDQVEDFADGWYASPKHYRDFGRLAEICIEDALFRDCLQVVLTMHPGAAHLTSACWPQGKLGPFPRADDETRRVVISALTVDGLVRLVSRYLASVRVSPRDGIEPFARESLIRLHKKSHGRPGTAIGALHKAVEIAVSNGVTEIGVDEIEDVFR
jgi:hypothetical protein